ncbi:SAM-dependent methyltransferase [Saccharothrix coeruleofusca]|uniref:methyltransferase domain-containing protein n=1 Tax=Saccharothrix coeruleofusca TaxID=33919 RepID=UPI001AE57F89|nr:methyltransferase domain-containing protein [Saccharothrix coeruleofusca]MBP2338183.1 SAM-dependent methyltransferase [Saccharothrix coeruleofusca]
MPFPRDVQAKIDANRRNWDARTPIHVASRFYGIGTRDPLGWFAPFEWADLGELAGREVAHLQCHLGVETMAFAIRGARTTGLDFSANAVAEARRIAAEAGLPVEYVHADVHDAAAALGTGRFDVVYTGKGALCYLPDLRRWADVVLGLLKPGGLLYIAEFHPLLTSLGPSPAPGDTPDLLLRHDYLEGRGAIEHDGTHTYTDGPPLASDPVNYEWAHGLGEVVTSLVAAGFRVDRLTESELLPWPRWPRMVRTDSGWWALPDDEPRIPLLYGLRAIKEG